MTSAMLVSHGGHVGAPDILTKEFDFEFANWYYKKILYLTVITNRCISVNLTTKTGFYKAQIVFVFMGLA